LAWRSVDWRGACGGEADLVEGGCRDKRKKSVSKKRVRRSERTPPPSQTEPKTMTGDADGCGPFVQLKDA